MNMWLEITALATTCFFFVYTERRHQCVSLDDIDGEAFTSLHWRRVGRGEGESNSILKCQEGPLQSLPVQTNRSAFADESLRLYTLIRAIDRTNEKLHICLTFDGCFFDCWRPLKRLRRLYTYSTKMAVHSPFVLYFRTLTESQDYAESNGRRTGEGRILKVATNTENKPALSSNAEEHHKDSQPGLPVHCPRYEPGTHRIQAHGVTAIPNCSLIIWSKNPNNQMFTTEVIDQHHTPTLLFLWTAPLSEPD